jgi:hypothetical protein
VKKKCAAGICLIAACFLSSAVFASGQDGITDREDQDVQVRVNVERAAVSDLRQRQVSAEREKSLLTAEIEQEILMISRLNRTIEHAAVKKQARVPRHSLTAIPARRYPVAASAPAAIDDESQAQIERLAGMKKDLIDERHTLEAAVKEEP